jgi:hypothetical protein
MCHAGPSGTTIQNLVEDLTKLEYLQWAKKMTSSKNRARHIYAMIVGAPLSELMVQVGKGRYALVAFGVTAIPKTGRSQGQNTTTQTTTKKCKSTTSTLGTNNRIEDGNSPAVLPAVYPAAATPCPVVAAPIGATAQQ